MLRIGIHIAVAVGWVVLIAGWAAYAEAGSADVSRGKSVYLRVCQTCHGMDGRGTGAMKLNPPAADLTSAVVQGKLDASLFNSVHGGRKNTAMGAWKHALSDAVIAYVRTLDGGAASTPRP